MTNRNQVRVLRWAAASAWITSAILVPVIFFAVPERRVPYLGIEALALSVAIATTVTAAVRRVARDRAQFFEQGYISGLLDAREPRVLSIGSLPKMKFPRQEDRQNSNRVS